MAKITVQVAGGREQQLEASTPADLKNTLGVPSHQASINGTPAKDDQVLNDYDFVILTEAIKGAGLLPASTLALTLPRLPLV